MAGPRVVLNHRGVEELLKSQGIQRELRRRAERIAEAARAAAPVGPGEHGGTYRDSIQVEEHMHPTRAISRVHATVDYAMVVEAKHGTLSRSLDAARGA